MGKSGLPMHSASSGPGLALNAPALREVLTVHGLGGTILALPPGSGNPLYATDSETQSVHSAWMRQAFLLWRPSISRLSHSEYSEAIFDWLS